MEQKLINNIEMKSYHLPISPYADLSLDLLINSKSSFVLNTLTRDCSLKAVSSDQIAQFNDNASAKYGSSSVCLPCGEILFASGRNPLYISLEKDSIFLSSKENRNANASSLTSPNFFILSLLSDNSLKANSGEINLHPNSYISSTIFLLVDCFLKKENMIDASTINILGNSSGISAPYNPCLLAILSLSSEPHLNAISSVILEFFKSSSATLNINFSDSLSFSAFATTEFISPLLSSLDPTSNSSGISIFSSAILPSQESNIETNYLKLSHKTGNLSISGTNCKGSGGSATCNNFVDIAELFPASEEVDSGDVVIVDFINKGKIKKSAKEYEKAVVGIVSTQPAIVIEGGRIVAMGGYEGQNNTLKPAIALAGRVPVKVTDENGLIKRGDYITASSKSGYEMKCSDELKCLNSVVGIAMENQKQSEDKIMVMVK